MDPPQLSPRAAPAVSFRKVRRLFFSMAQAPPPGVVWHSQHVGWTSA